MPRSTATAPGAETLSVPLGDVRLEIRRELRRIDELRLDPDNPRLASVLRQRATGRRRKPSQKRLQALLWRMPQVRALARSIRQNGGLLEDPVIRADGTLVEGNCRVVALRELARTDPQDERFARLHVRVLPEDVTEEQISLLLGDLHIAQKIQWEAFDQAEYLWRMHRQRGKDLAHLATHLRWSRPKLLQKIAAYEATRVHVRRTGEPERYGDFVYFDELMSKKELRDRRDEDPEFVERFGDWIVEGRLRQPKDVRDLPAILRNEEAYQAFVTEGIQPAREILEHQNPTRASTLYWFVDRAAEKLESIPLNEVEALRSGDDVRIRIIRRLSQALAKVEKISGIEL